MACVRIGDAAEQVAQLANINQQWAAFVTELREWETIMQRLSNDSITRFPGRRWGEFLARLQRMIDNEHGPFRGFDQEAQR